jgi:iron complex transport system substrate-binding protein
MKCTIFIFAFVCAGLSACNKPSDVAPEKHGIVTIAPNLTETVFALGEGARVIGVGDFCDFPPEVAQLPRAGGYLDPNFEKLTLLDPGLLIVPGKHPELTKFGASRGIRVLNVHMDNLETIQSGARTIGEALGCPERAEALLAHLFHDLDAVKAAVANQPRPKVFVQVTRTEHDFSNLFTVGQSSFISEMIGVAGGDNIFNDNDQAYFEASKESLLLRAPDVILEFHAGETLSDGETLDYKYDWNAFPTVPAVKNGRIYIITESYSLRPGPRVDLIARLLAALLHPDAKLPAP